MADEARFHPMTAEYAVDPETGTRKRTGMGPFTGVAITKHDYRTKKGLLSDVFGNEGKTLEEAGVKLYDPETGKALELPEPEREAAPAVAETRRASRKDGE
jgi:hypothetical protein